jgi:hypothetical protein
MTRHYAGSPGAGGDKYTLIRPELRRWLSRGRPAPEPPADRSGPRCRRLASSRRTGFCGTPAGHRGCRSQELTVRRPVPAIASRVLDRIQVGFELGDHGQHVEQQPADRVGRVIDGPPRRTRRVVSSSAIARASGSDRASRSSLVTTSVSPSRHAADAWRRPDRSRLLPVNPWSR